MNETLLLTATVQPGDVIYCDRRDVDRRLDDYLFALRFWIGESLISRIVFVENSGFDLSPFEAVVHQLRNRGKQVELLSFKQPPFDRNLGKSYGEAKIVEYALANSTLLDADTFILKGTGRYYATNFFRVWPHVKSLGYPFVLTNFYTYPTACDSRYFGAKKEFFQSYFLPAATEIDDSSGRSFECVLAVAVCAAVADGHPWRRIPGGGFLVDGVQGSTNTTFPYPFWKRYLYRVIASLRNGAPFKWRLGAPVARPGQGSLS